MAEAPAVAKEFSAATKDIGDRIAGLTLIQAKELADYLKDAYVIEPAAGGVMMAAMPGAGAAHSRRSARSWPSACRHSGRVTCSASSW